MVLLITKYTIVRTFICKTIQNLLLVHDETEKVIVLTFSVYWFIEIDQNYQLHQFINSVQNVKAYMSKVLRVCRLAKYCVLVVHVAGCAAFCILGSCLRLCTSCGHFEAVDDQVVLAGATTCSSGGGHWAGLHAHLGESFSFDRVGCRTEWQEETSSDVHSVSEIC